MMDQLLNLSGVSLDYSLNTIIINLILSGVLGMIFAAVYKKTHRGLSYSQSFINTLVLITVAGAVLMMLVGNSLARAFSLFGAFSIIRFRTAIKDTKDMAFVFIHLIVGMAVGTNNYLLSLLSSAGLIGLIALLHRLNFGASQDFDYLLNFYQKQTVGAKSNPPYQTVFNRFFKKFQLINLQVNQDEKSIQQNYYIKLKSVKDQPQFLRELQRVKGLSRIQLMNIQNEVEY